MKKMVRRRKRKRKRTTGKRRKERSTDLQVSNASQAASRDLLPAGRWW